jgi:hypothetical protein
MFLTTSSQVVEDVSDLITYGLTDEEIAVYLAGEYPEDLALQFVQMLRGFSSVLIYNN